VTEPALDDSLHKTWKRLSELAGVLLLSESSGGALFNRIFMSA
jgi:hypothetical protein